jgi:hypothetical protein
MDDMPETTAIGTDGETKNQKNAKNGAARRAVALLLV